MLSAPIGPTVDKRMLWNSYLLAMIRNTSKQSIQPAKLTFSDWSTGATTFGVLDYWIPDGPMDIYIVFFFPSLSTFGLCHDLFVGLLIMERATAIAFLCAKYSM